MLQQSHAHMNTGRERSSVNNLEIKKLFITPTTVSASYRQLGNLPFSCSYCESSSSYRFIYSCHPKTFLAYSVHLHLCVLRTVRLNSDRIFESITLPLYFLPFNLFDRINWLVISLNKLKVLLLKRCFELV